MKKEEVTERGCFEELARVCRLIVGYQHDKKSLEDCRKAIAGTLQQLNQIQDEKTLLRTLRAEKKQRIKPIGECDICGKNADVRGQYGYRFLCMPCLKKLDGGARENHS